MVKQGLFFLLWIISPFCAALGLEEPFQHLKKNPQGLYNFLKAMPKGGDLHYHLSGGVYPETLLELAAKGNYCLDLSSFVISPNMSKTDNCAGISGQDLLQKPTLYKKTLAAWSMQDFVPDAESGHDHFFKSFEKFDAVVEDNKVAILASIMQRAAAQHEQYMEIITGSSLPDLPPKQAMRMTLKAGSYAELRKQFLQDKVFVSEVNILGKEMDDLLPAARKYLGCDTKPEEDVCKLEVSFQYSVLREKPIEIVFLQALYAFEAASKSQSLVAVNLVQAEDGSIAVRDYKEHMQIFNFFHQMYPNVHIALHAGELAKGMLPPEAYRFHIFDAIRVGQAERIGHGVDIDLENNAAKLLEYMASKPIAVEINLTSNRYILNITGKQHPLGLYLENKVPVVLSTDDEGILRTDLTQEYYTAALEQDRSFSELKQISRNALTYSFLKGKSIWQDANKAVLIPECSDLKSQKCIKFVGKNKKARLQQILELKFLDFERQFLKKMPTYGGQALRDPHEI